MAEPFQISQDEIQPINYFSELADYLGHVAIMNTICEQQYLGISNQTERGVLPSTKVREDYKPGHISVGWIDVGANPKKNYWFMGMSFKPSTEGEHLLLGDKYSIDQPVQIAIFNRSLNVQDPDKK